MDKSSFTARKASKTNCDYRWNVMLGRMEFTVFVLLPLVFVAVICPGVRALEVNNTSSTIDSNSSSAQATDGGALSWPFSAANYVSTTLTPSIQRRCNHCVNVTTKYNTSGSQIPRSDMFQAWCGVKGRTGVARGWGVHVVAEDGGNHGCTPVVNNISIAKQPWIAFVRRGDCKFTTKIFNSAVMHTASAIIVYNNQANASMVVMSHNVSDEMAVFTTAEAGQSVVSLIDNGTEVFIQVEVPESCLNLFEDIPTPRSVKDDGRMNVGLVCGVVLAAVVITVVIAVIVFRKNICWKVTNRNAGMYRFRNLV